MKKTAGIIAFVLVAAVIAFFAFTGQEKETTFTAMDTVVTLKLRGIGAGKQLDEIKAFVSDYSDNVISRHSSSSRISFVNSKGSGRLGDDLSADFDLLYSVYRDSGGAFDFTLGALSDLWGIGTPRAAVPSAEEIQQVLSCCGAGKTDYKNGEIKLPEGAVLDLGAAGKGMALDKISGLLSANSKINRGVISLGGSILLYGKKSETFTIGIQDPAKKNNNAVVLELGPCLVSTSGSYERYFEKDGIRYHHIFDPATGYPAESGILSVTVVSQDSGLLSDALSTACFVLGSEKGMELARKYNCEALFIDKNGNITVSDNLREKIEIVDPAFTLR